MKAVAWKSAALGFLFSIAMITLVCSAYWLFAETLADRVPDPELRSDFANGFRSLAVSDFAFFAISLAIYWFLSAALGKGNVVSVKSSNYLLLVAIGTALLLAANSYFFWVDVLCDQFPESHSVFSMSHISECPSVGIALATLQVLAFVIGLISLALRIFVSRKVNSSNI